MVGIFIAASRLPEVSIQIALLAQSAPTDRGTTGPGSRGLVSVAALGATFLAVGIGVTLLLLRDRLAQRLFPMPTPSRVITLVAWIVLSTSGALSAQSPLKTPSDSQTVVFVCEHGTVKSVVALAYFQQLAQQRHLTIRAISRGTAPDPRVPALVRNGLRLDGLTLGPFTPAQFTLADLSSAIAVISFDQPSVAGIVGGRVPTASWDGLPAVSDDYRVARDSIRHRVSRLVDSLARISRKPGSP